MPQNRNDFLKLIAALLMLLDHIGAIFFPHILLMRLPGRLSFPIFAYYTALGASHTTNIKRMLGKILIAAFITQPIYSAVLPGHLNILFTMFYGAVIVYLWKKNTRFSANAAFCLAAASLLLPILDYEWYGIATILLFYMFETRFAACLLSQGILQIVYFAMGSHIIQAFSVLAVPLLHIKRLPQVKLPRYFFYIFYPLHLGVLLLIRQIL